MKRIAFDVMSGDKGYETALTAAVSFLKEEKQGHLIFVGDETKINAFLNKPESQKQLKKVSKDLYSVVNATEVITMTDSPLEIRRKSDSSLAVAINLVKKNKADGLLSAGSSAALLAGVYLELGVIAKNVKPFFCGVYKTLEGPAYFGDSGANLDTSAENMLAYAKMMNVLAKVNGNENPKVALLNNGEEEGKGMQLQKDAYQLLKKEKTINFIGNVEGNHILNGPQTITVAEGFSGNTTSKAVEGSVIAFQEELKKNIKETTGGKLGYLFMKKAFKKMRAVFDLKKLGGAPILGINGLVIKAHGSSDEIMLYYAIKSIIHLAESEIIDKLKKGLKK